MDDDAHGLVADGGRTVAGAAAAVSATAEGPVPGLNGAPARAPAALNADYTAGAAMRTLLALLYALACALFLPVRRRHVARIVGLEHLPPHGPFILVANHLSYMDDFLLAYAIRQHCGEKLYIPTNTKAFRGFLRSALHLAGGAVEIDPADREQSYRVLRQLVADRKIILMFPEGTRSDGTGLLPFRFGAFNLARDTGVPIVPVALVDTHRVLPKHHLWPRSGARASAAFLPPLAPAALAPDQVEAAKEGCRAAIAGQVYGERAWSTAAAAQATARHLAARAEALVERLIERGPETIRPAELEPIFALAELARDGGTDSHAMRVQYFRAWGFRVLSAPKWQVPFLLFKFRAVGEAAVREDPDQPFVQYVWGQFHLRAPAFLGGRKRVAVAVFDHAYRCAARYGVGRQRFAISYAEALARRGWRARARRVLEREFGQDPRQGQGGDERLRRRALRAAELLLRLRHPTD